MRDPFTVLRVSDDADDAEIRRRYLALVRQFPPDRAPERFQELRVAYEALSDERKRLETRLLRTNTTALTRLRMNALHSGSGREGASAGPPSRAKLEIVTALLAEGIACALNDQPKQKVGK